MSEYDCYMTHSAYRHYTVTVRRENVAVYLTERTYKMTTREHIYIV